MGFSYQNQRCSLQCLVLQADPLSVPVSCGEIRSECLLIHFELKEQVNTFISVSKQLGAELGMKILPKILWEGKIGQTGEEFGVFL